MSILSFIIPLRAPDTTNDWKQVSYNCIRTISSILQQTDRDFDVYLVCNKEPEGLQSSRKLNVITDKFSTPTTLKEMRRDQQIKIKKALVEIRNQGEADRKFLMRVDADDFISKRLVSFIKKNQESNGFYFYWGYLFQRSCNYVLLQPNFYLISGTSAIVRLPKQDFPKSENDPQKTWLKLFWNHQGVVNNMKERGKPMENLPFIGAVHQCGTGENISNINMERKGDNLKGAIKKIIFRRKFSNKIREEFSIKEELVQ